MRAIKELENRMPESQTWRDEIIMAAMQWPKGVRAYKEKGYWRLLGASDAVVAEFVRCAERIQQESGFPRGEASPTDSLLEGLKTWGTHVRASSPVRLYKRARVTSHSERVTIYPLRSAVVAYLKQMELNQE
jgi:hypothetical protein